jgi:hypothetical protein
MRLPSTVSLAKLAVLLLSCTTLTGCLVAGVSSSGHFFIFPSIGVIVLIIIVLLVMRRR